MTQDSAVIKKWGNSQGIILSKHLLDLAKLQINDRLDIEVRENEIVLKKAFRHKPFEERLAEYNGEISVCPFDWGEPQGKEVL